MILDFDVLASIVLRKVISTGKSSYFRAAARLATGELDSIGCIKLVSKVFLNS